MTSAPPGVPRPSNAPTKNVNASLTNEQYAWVSGTKIYAIDLKTGVVRTVIDNITAQSLPGMSGNAQYYDPDENSILYISTDPAQRLVKVFTNRITRATVDLKDIILALKREKNAVILAHNYQTPEIYNCVADYVGDSLQLAKMAAASEADVIVQGGVHFMAETSKVLNPAKTVLIPDSQAGCSLAESITAADIRALRAQYPGVPIVAYVNTSAEVKAEVDICCTSSNAVKVVESLGVEFKMDYVIGRTLTVDQMLDDGHDAVFIAAGDEFAVGLPVVLSG